jgi:hypothetical protein
VCGLTAGSAGFESSSGHAGFVVNKVALGQVFSELFGSPYQEFHRMPHTHHHTESPGAGTVGHLVPSVILEEVPLHLKKNNNNNNAPLFLLTNASKAGKK